MGREGWVRQERKKKCWKTLRKLSTLFEVERKEFLLYEEGSFHVVLLLLNIGTWKLLCLRYRDKSPLPAKCNFFKSKYVKYKWTWKPCTEQFNSKKEPPPPKKKNRWYSWQLNLSQSTTNSYTYSYLKKNLAFDLKSKGVNWVLYLSSY